MPSSRSRSKKKVGPSPLSRNNTNSTYSTYNRGNSVRNQPNNKRKTRLSAYNNINTNTSRNMGKRISNMRKLTWKKYKNMKKTKRNNSLSKRLVHQQHMLNLNKRTKAYKSEQKRLAEQQKLNRKKRLAEAVASMSGSMKKASANI